MAEYSNRDIECCYYYVGGVAASQLAYEPLGQMSTLGMLSFKLVCYQKHSVLISWDKIHLRLPRPVCLLGYQKV